MLMSECTVYVFLLGVLWFQISHLSFQSIFEIILYMYIFMSMYIIICVYIKKALQFYSFACSCLILLILFIKEAIFSPLCILVSFVID